jgi:Fur family ferric uptake transcriptional regulator
VLTEESGFRSAQEIYSLLRGSDEAVGLATVYRSLQLLADSGDVDVVRDDSGELLYRRCAGGGHHHHLVCRSCGAAFEVESAAVERWASSVASSHGFSDVEHSLEVFGICGSCAPSDRR